MISYLSAVILINNIGVISFLDSELLEDFMFKFADMNGDGVITNTDFELLLGTMPNELGLALDRCTEEEKLITSREYLIRLQLKERINGKIINVRGDNYETVTHQLPFITKTIMSAFSGEVNNEITSKGMFRGWLIANIDLLEYWFKIVCPPGWISQASIERVCFRKPQAEHSLAPLQRIIQSLYANNEEAFEHYLTQGKLPGDIRSKSNRKASCCWCFTRSSKVSPEIYIFERDWVKKGELIYMKEQKQRKCILIYKYNYLYLLSDVNKLLGNS